MKDWKPLKIAVESKNVWAFMRAIRFCEGTYDEDGYRRIVGGQLFTDFSRHPGKLIHIERYNVWSSAAGAYQITRTTWNALVRMYGFPDFTPATQDLAAVALIQGRGALPAVLSGDLAAAVHWCAPEWASLPGSKAGQRVEHFSNLRRIYLENGGIIKGEA